MITPVPLIKLMKPQERKMLSVPLIFLFGGFLLTASDPAEISIDKGNLAAYFYESPPPHDFHKIIKIPSEWKMIKRKRDFSYFPFKPLQNFNKTCAP